MKRLRIEHTTGFSYQGDVSASYNEARMTPLTTDRQMTVESRVEVDPRTRSYRYLDYWATVVDVFDIHVPHTTLTVTATSVIGTPSATSKSIRPRRARPAEMVVVERCHARSIRRCVGVS